LKLKKLENLKKPYKYAKTPGNLVYSLFLFNPKNETGKLGYFD